jgi:seryl-tRNA synthetase
VILPADRDRLLEELERSGDLHVLGMGRIAMAGRLLAVCEFFDERIRGLARRVGAVPQDYPDLIATAHLERVEFFASFPHFATFAAPFESVEAATGYAPGHPRLARPECALAPAVCYHTYACLGGRCLPSDRYTITARGRCCRFEGSALERSPARLWSFTMREIVTVGAANEVARVRRRLSRATVRLATDCGIPSRLAPAADPFFLPVSRGKALVQRLNELKLELLTPTGEDPEMAIASFNLHQDFFGSRMQMTLPSGETAHSGCAAFGLERWGYAFLLANGTNPESWPAAVRRHYARYAPR